MCDVKIPLVVVVVAMALGKNMNTLQDLSCKPSHREGRKKMCKTISSSSYPQESAFLCVISHQLQTPNATKIPAFLDAKRVIGQCAYLFFSIFLFRKC